MCRLGLHAWCNTCAEADETAHFLLIVQIEAAALGRILLALDQNKPARSVELTKEEAAAVKPLYLLTMKPMVYAANVAEDDLADLGAANKHVQTMRKKADADKCELIIVSAQVIVPQIKGCCNLFSQLRCVLSESHEWFAWEAHAAKLLFLDQNSGLSQKHH